MATDAPVQIPRQRISELIEREEKQLNERTAALEARCTSARQVHLSGGVASSYQLRDPWPIYLERGAGPQVWDVDGNEMWDFHNGFGSMVQGHAHPAIGAAIAERYGSGTHFAAPTEDAVVVGDELARRWGLPKWRFTNSGSRVHDGRDPDRARRHRPRDDREDLRLLPRPPRRRDGLDRRRVRPDRRPREPRLAALRRRHPAGRRRPHDPRAVQRRGRDGAPHRAPRPRRAASPPA